MSSRRASRKRHDPYPHRGTVEGEALIGTCDGRDCGKAMRRGDPFVITLSGHLVCRRCWERPDWLENLGDPSHQVPFEEKLPQKEKAAQPEAETAEYGEDNPYF